MKNLSLSCLVLLKPKLGTNVLQILHGHSKDFHFLISLLKPSRDSLLNLQSVYLKIDAYLLTLVSHDF